MWETVATEATPSIGLWSNLVTYGAGDVVYLGMLTRFVVELDQGGELVAVRQNLETSSQDALNQSGNRVRLQWNPVHTFDLSGGETREEN